MDAEVLELKIVALLHAERSAGKPMSARTHRKLFRKGFAVASHVKGSVEPGTASSLVWDYTTRNPQIEIDVNVINSAGQRVAVGEVHTARGEGKIRKEIWIWKGARNFTQAEAKRK